ncbi:MAG: tRNA (adenosine(37)-N6)-threonylcarbamoyltransferase complex transferase subunit TsaD [Spirochaetes bacterium GWF1_41_5]|nr:MAG: tRNA (adenosine(37)-N6)-threonylcarbamoyltransferase complex transferase subunit TsaD [Spirochaetes bacterium GWF1_41_5]HBE01417.1 tRNA (adenosine(37)-N6)-threonylcarbamoyltransferase complex transferase subunit TsaD [Spirochaetia bacterium]
MIILGIETSCDDTSAALVKDGLHILHTETCSQDTFHRPFAGVVPEIAARKHTELLLPAVDLCLKKTGLSAGQIDAIAVTVCPGLAGSLLAGLCAAKAFSWAWNKPLIPVNHLAAHLYALEMSGKIEYPYIGLLVSGGHTAIMYVETCSNIKIMGQSLDDACGEAFDKISKHYKWGYPGGPVIDKMSVSGNKEAVLYPDLDKSYEENEFNISYSGLKTAVIYHTDRYKTGTIINENDIAASFQKKALDPLCAKTIRAAKKMNLTQIGIAGGVSANSYLRKIFAGQQGFNVHFPSPTLCTDNAAMVAGFAFHKAQHKNFSLKMLSLNVQARSNGFSACVF